MKNSTSIIALIAVTCFSFSACSGGSSSPPTPTPTPTTPTPTTPTPTTPTPTPTTFSADAGYGRIAAPNKTVEIDATVTGASSLAWTQLSGTSVSLNDTTSEDPSFTTPNVTSTETLVFQLTADDGNGASLVDTVDIEVWLPADSTSDRTVLGDFSSQNAWQCDVAPAETPSVTVTDFGGFTNYDGNGIPDHATGTFPNNRNPNTIFAISADYDVTNSPVKTNTASDMNEFGITIDGVKLERDTAERYMNNNAWSYEAITPALAEGTTPTSEWSWLGTDCNNAHVQPTGSYHYHGMMESLINRLGERSSAPAQMILGGYAADGFPFYLRYGLNDPNDADSGLKTIEASWELKSGTRASGPGGAFDGTFREDWEFVDGSGDTDQCGGRFGVTPEYPAGIYHYYITDDYPYIPRCVFGTPDSSFRSR